MNSPPDKLAAANAVLASFSSSRIELRPGGWYVCWESSYQGAMARRWQCRGGQDFYPVWSHKWPGGGTATTALSQLIRWLRDKPVLPIMTWRYWASERVALLPIIAVEDLLAAGYPENVPCVLCGEIVDAGIDWWNLNGVSGPCCRWTTGCRQKGGAM